MSSRHIRGPWVFNTVLNYTGASTIVVANESLILVNKAVGAATAVTLPAPGAAGGKRAVWVIDKLGDAATNNITVTPASGTINGAANHVISENFGGQLYLDNGTEWETLLPPSVSAAEIGFVNGVTAGVAAASKAVVLDASLRGGVTTPIAELAVTLPVIGQGAPTAETGAATITIADILTGIVTLTHTVGATVALTLDTGTAMDTGKPATVGAGQAIDWYLINLSAAAADTGTLTAASGHTIVGNPIVQSSHVSTGGITGNSAHFRSRRTAANTWISYRLG